MRKIFYCTKCGFTGSDEEEKSPACPDCGFKLSVTSIAAEAWHEMTPEQKIQAKTVFGDKNRKNSECSQQLERDIHQVAKDIHFFKVLAVIGLIVLIASICIPILLILPMYV